MTLTEFFTLNRDLILFVYGLVFFLLGVTIFLQARSSSRLDLARSLRWLALFGITHAFYEWGDMFLPIQSAYLSKPAMRFLGMLHIELLGISFACLLHFGVAVLRPSGRTRWLYGLAPALLFAWQLVTFFVLNQIIPDARLWRNTANALARYFIGFPGGLLAAYGLRKHTFQRIRPLNVPRIVRTLEIAGISLGVYALLGGLIPPPVEFFPGNWLNTATFTKIMVAPPSIYRSLMGLVILVAIVRALEVFDLETLRRIEALEQQQILAADHERLARDLHDGAIQKVYTAGLLVESASRLTGSETEIGQRLKRAVVVLNDSIADLRRNLADLHDATVLKSEPLSQSLRGLAEDPYFNSLVQIILDMQLGEEKSLSPLRSSHVLAIINEALSNTVRHAQARKVHIEARDQGSTLLLVVKDDGMGISASARNGYGMRNMRDRARLLNGSLNFVNDKGTSVVLEIPWTD
ncbi:MAG: hypothetical protein HY869_20745 [Chloroflexi bacterium]|nr:hypothetical protein [Chloroflexota bacterium]